MNLRFRTHGTSLAVLGALYREAGEPWATVGIMVPPADLKEQEDAVLDLELQKLGEKTHAYSFANGDKAYRTVARFKDHGDTFTVDVVIHARQADLESATLYLDPQALEIFERYVQ